MPKKIKKEFHFLSLTNIEVAKSSSEKLVERFNLLLKEYTKKPDDPRCWNKMNAIKTSVIKRMNKAKERGRDDIAQVYMDAQGLMVLPEKGERFWEYSDYWED